MVGNAEATDEEGFPRKQSARFRRSGEYIISRFFQDLLQVAGLGHCATEVQQTLECGRFSPRCEKAGDQRGAEKTRIRQGRVRDNTSIQQEGRIAVIAVVIQGQKVPGLGYELLRSCPSELSSKRTGEESRLFYRGKG